MSRAAEVRRTTKETAIALTLDLDGTGEARVSTPVGRTAGGPRASRARGKRRSPGRPTSTASAGASSSHGVTVPAPCSSTRRIQRPVARPWGSDTSRARVPGALNVLAWSAVGTSMMRAYW